ncbi:hypothetical protein [Salinimonas iocasae]|uniref:Uncharacterized protein n=1 Tax=Salinimonas iocasae TaxID=2572577 RepID=A0A5B7YFC9_9ALTE|nr:hypothetical protein [Salinimonas iocasae]QCZ94407.1 hypothetical protein FBQ74_13440 [Salinimonas iocasae]
MSATHYKHYIKGVLSNVFAYTLIDLLFTILYAVIIGGLYYLYAILIGEQALVNKSQILGFTQIFIGFYLIAISFTSINAYIKFKKIFKASKMD